MLCLSTKWEKPGFNGHGRYFCATNVQPFGAIWKNRSQVNLRLVKWEIPQNIQFLWGNLWAILGYPIFEHMSLLEKKRKTPKWLVTIW